MRRGTLWTILVLVTIAVALIAYYLLPGWWAALVNVWVQASSPWITGLLLGFAVISLGFTALRIAIRIPARSQRVGAALARIVLGAVAAVALVVLILTVFIALGITEPLAQAQQQWRHGAPGLLAATLVGALVAIILMLALTLLFKQQVPTGEVEPAVEEPEDRDIGDDG